MVKKILIIDDEERLRSLISRILELEGYKTFQAGDAKSGLKLLQTEEIPVILCDVKLPDINGVELVRRMRQIHPYCEIINLTAYGNVTDGVQAMKNGAFDYLIKGDDQEKILPLVAKAMDKALLQKKVQLLEQKLENHFGFESITGISDAINEAKNLAMKVSVTDTTVLLLGETGTGKEVFAQAIHHQSKRSLRPFVAVNCSSFSKDMLESELFGYKAGAFTGAQKDKRGHWEEAEGGTIFLDEIGEMGLDLQAKLLRVLENGEYVKLGDTKTLRSNVRIITATNRDLAAAIEQGLFRSDLYYRLSVFEIKLPALRERPGDISLLARHYLEEFSQKINTQVNEMHPEFLSKLESHFWKGNVRQLKNTIERAVILSDHPTLTANLLPLEFHVGADAPVQLDLASVEKTHIQKVLHYTKGNKAETARLLNIGLTTLYRKIEEYQLV